MKLTTIAAVVAAAVSVPLVAQTERDLDSHEHGAALMNVAIEGNTLFIELDSPWNNLVGFEHAPRTDEQHELVDNAVAQLNDADALFLFAGSDCKLAEATIENGIEDGDHDDHHDDDHDDDHHDDEKTAEHDDDHHDDEHDDDHHDDEKTADHDDDHHDDDHDDDHHDDEKTAEHDDDHHDDDHDDHAGHDDEGETHSSVRAFYSFECGDTKKLSTVDVNLLSVWSGFEEIDVQLIGPGGQSAAELTPGAALLDLSKVR